jgi:hypothetical protein
VFSRFLAINIVFHLIKSGKTRFVWIIINVIAYICTFSGTGLILLASCILSCIINSKNVLKKNILKNIVITFILIVAVLPLMIDVSTVVDYFAGRLLEITSNNLSYSSGATRFIYSWYLLFSALRANLFWGNGPIGIDAIRTIASGINVGGWVSEGNGFIQMGSQYGLVGLLFTVMIILRLRGRKSSVIYQNILWTIVFVYPFLGGIVNSTWFIFASWANLNITDKYVPRQRYSKLIKNNHSPINQGV